MTTIVPSSNTLSARKFLFERSFDSGLASAAQEREPPPQKYTKKQIDALKQEAFEAGQTAGQKAMMEDQQQYMNVLLSQLDQKLGHLIKDSAAHWQRQLTHLQEIALLIARRLLPAYAARYGLDEIQDIVTQVISDCAREPRLVVRVGEAQFDAVSAGIKTITEQQAYAGKVVILAEPALGPADCRVEWADGGIERDMEALWKDIDRIIEERRSAFANPSSEALAKDKASAECQTPNATNGEKS